LSEEERTALYRDHAALVEDLAESTEQIGGAVQDPRSRSSR